MRYTEGEYSRILQLLGSSHFLIQLFLFLFLFLFNLDNGTDANIARDEALQYQKLQSLIIFDSIRALNCTWHG
ncbi:MAG: hypothetical protein ACNYPE_13895 [Candidatus Azotimanducaceae bacterium WSBS_2022_MAG_OTU7]